MATPTITRHFLTGPTPGIPYYRRPDTTVQSLVKGMPTQLLRSLLTGTRHTRAWAPYRHTSLQRAVEKLLDYVGGCLQREALLKCINPITMPESYILLSGHKAFEEPLGLVPQLDLCMLVNGQALRARKHIAFHNSGYIQVKIGRRPKSRGGWLSELAHRLVLWSIWGPPPADLVRPVCMHVCNNSMCLNPDHLVWGTSLQNTSSHADQFARQNLADQGRVTFN